MTLALTQAEILRRMTAAPPSLDLCEEAVRYAEQRHRRATAKLDAARVEHIASLIALCHAKAERTRFIANCPGDEPVML